MGAIRRNGSLRVAAFAMAVVVVPALAALRVAGSLHASFGSRPLAALLFLGLMANGIGFWSFGRSIAALAAQATSAFQCIQPFVTLIGSVLILAEPFTPTALAGGALVLLGVWRVERARIRGA